MTTVLNMIKAVLGVTHVLDADFVHRLYKVYEDMWKNPAFPKPPVDLVIFKAAIDTYSAAVTAALDGGKAAIAWRDKCRADIVPMYHLLGHYVSAACNNDMNTFVSSGFIPAKQAQRGAPQPVSVPWIAAVDQGSTGQLLVTIRPVPKARRYDLRCAALAVATVDQEEPGWSIALAASTRPPIAVNYLIPGTVYTFQARAFGKLGFSDWSDPVNRMCT
jgi:hypothetical protein